MRLSEMTIERPGPAPECAKLVSQLAEASNRLVLLEQYKADMALAITRGDSKAVKQYSLLVTEADQLRQQVDVLTNAIVSFDAARARAVDEKQMERRMKAEARQKEVLEMLYREQSGYIRNTIERLKNEGDKDGAKRWEAALAGLRQQLETSLALPWQRPAPETHYVGNP